MPVTVPQLQFDYLLGPKTKEWFSIADAEKVTGMKKSFVHEAIQQGQNNGIPFGSHEYNAGNGSRNTHRIPRFFVEGLLINSANYDSAMKLQLGCSVCDSFKGDRASLIQLRRHIDQLLTQ